MSARLCGLPLACKRLVSAWLMPWRLPRIALPQLAKGVPLFLLLVTTACSSGDQRALEDMIRARAINPAKVEISEAIIYRDKNDARRACLMVTDYNQWGEALPTTRVNAWYIFKSQSWHFDNFWDISDGLTCEKYVPAESKDGAGVAAQASRNEPMLMPPANDAPAPLATGSGEALIDGCYHLDSCSYSRLLSVATIKQRGGERLLRASIEHGEVSDATGADADRQRINWSGSPTTIYALCSTKSPLIAWAQGDSTMAEEFDFAGAGIAGAQQNDANLYQALCHDIYDNSLATQAASFGYRPLTPEGGRGEFAVDDPEQLLGQ